MSKKLRFKRLKNINPVWILVAPVIVYLQAFAIFPLVYSLYVSFTDYTLTYYNLIDLITMRVEFVGLRNYYDIVLGQRSTFFWNNTLYITALYVIIPVLAELVLGLLLASAALRVERLGKITRMLLVFPVLMIPVAVGFIWMYMMNPRIGILNNSVWMLFNISPSEWYFPWWTDASTALFSVIMIDIWQWTPFAFLILLACMGSISKELYEAADVDGASSWKRFRYITLPMLYPPIILVVLFRVTDLLKFIDVPFVTGNVGLSTETMSFYIYRIAWRELSLQYASAESYFLLAIIYSISFILLKLYGRR